MIARSGGGHKTQGDTVLWRNSFRWLCRPISPLRTIAHGSTLPLVALARLRQELAGDPDFLRSQWTDPHALVLANSFDAGFSHLASALIIGLTLGALGAIGATATVWPKGSRQTRSLPA